MFTTSCHNRETFRCMENKFSNRTLAVFLEFAAPGVQTKPRDCNHFSTESFFYVAPHLQGMM